MYGKNVLGRVPIPPIGMAIVRFTGTGSSVSQTKEFYVYGNERVAMIVPNTLGTTPSRIQYNEATFFLTDHLGSTRVAYMSTATVGSSYIINALNYYPYGKVLWEYDNGAGDKYLTTQHERDQETSLDYRGARYYDSDIARFLSLDPLAVKYPSFSAYNYVVGNPVLFIDPDGKEVIGSDGKAVTYTRDENGNVVWSENATDDIKEVGNAMLATSVGEKSFNNWQNAKTKVTIVVDRKTAAKNVDEFGVTEHGHGLNEEKQFKEITVIFYVNKIKEKIKEGSGNRYEGASYEEALGAIGSHEEGHNRPEQILLDRKVSDELDQNPTQNIPFNLEVDFRNEYHEKHPETREKTSKGMKQYKDHGYVGTN